MLRWALGFFIVALLAAVPGFTGIAVAAAGIAKIIFLSSRLSFFIDEQPPPCAEPEAAILGRSQPVPVC
jgi:uncharacterized membrane protein YtjA (UPF0391 family)